VGREILKRVFGLLQLWKGNTILCTGFSITGGVNLKPGSILGILVLRLYSRTLLIFGNVDELCF
jgi:hypothetical protein